MATPSPAWHQALLFCRDRGPVSPAQTWTTREITPDQVRLDYRRVSLAMVLDGPSDYHRAMARALMAGQVVFERLD